MNESGKRLNYWLTKEDLDPNKAGVKASDMTPYAARDRDGNRQILHVYSPYRFSQRRGVTLLAPASDTIGMHDDIQFATLVKSQMASLIALLHERGPNWEPGSDQQKGERTYESSGGYTKTIEGVSCGLEVFGDRDEKLSAFSPNIPSPEFFPHAMMILTFIAINMDMPVAVLLLDPSKTNFSGWRGAIDQARMRFKQWQQWLVGAFHTPVYKWKLRQWAQTDNTLAAMLENSPATYMSHRWNPPTFPYIEPMTDVGADLLQQRNALSSPRRLHAARGRDWDELSSEIVDDNAMAIEKAIVKAADLNTRYKEQNVNIHWRELISLPTPDGVQIAFPQPQTEQDRDTE
jgi:capsid protein